MPHDDSVRNPFEGVTDYFSELNRLRRTGTHGPEPGHEERQRTHASAWVPATDICVRGDDLLIKMELAGVSPDDVNLSFAHSILTVSGNRRPDPEIDSESGFYVRERFYGEFRRAITLPEGTDRSQITAEFDDGLVEITVAGGARHADDSKIDLRTKKKSASPRRRPIG
ncbi:MAG: Hsp20/alpha crystallin family protein [Nocardioidaceae bacterium]